MIKSDAIKMISKLRKHFDINLLEITEYENGVEVKNDI